ncbi:hypothetical protein HAX54_013867, partial [Datura stramonium]|nr:hypothetical protein [Datura stramonium]
MPVVVEMGKPKEVDSDEEVETTEQVVYGCVGLTKTPVDAKELATDDSFSHRARPQVYGSC